MKAIVVKFHGHTETRPARLSATADGVKGMRAGVALYPSTDVAARDLARKLCERQDWGPCTLIEGALPNGDRVYVFDDERSARVTVGSSEKPMAGRRPKRL